MDHPETMSSQEGREGRGVYSQKDKHKPQLVKKATREKRGQKS